MPGTTARTPTIQHCWSHVGLSLPSFPSYPGLCYCSSSGVPRLARQVLFNHWHRLVQPTVVLLVSEHKRFQRSCDVCTSFQAGGTDCSQCLLASHSGFLAHMRLAELAMLFQITIAVLPALRVVALLDTRPGRRFPCIKIVPKTRCCDIWDFD